MKDINLAIVGCTGAVGRKALEILEEGEISLKINKLKLFASKRSVGSKIMFNGLEYTVEETKPSLFKDIDIAIFSVGSELSKEIAPKIASSGTIVVDNSSAFRMEENIPLVAAGVNDIKLQEHKGIIANPNCSTIQMVCALKPIYDKVGIKRIVVSTYQAVSGTGNEAMAELKNQSLDYVSGNSLKNEIYPHQIAFNLIPHIDEFDEKGNTKEELKMINETRKILKDEKIGIAATTVRVPVFIGHSESINIETKQKISPKEVKDLLSKKDNLIVLDNPSKNEYPMPSSISGKNQVFIGRIREDKSVKNGINMWVVADNLRKGAALNAIQISEYLTKNNLI